LIRSLATLTQGPGIKINSRQKLLKVLDSLRSRLSVPPRGDTKEAENGVHLAPSAACSDL
jgi:hypothetical protein